MNELRAAIDARLEHHQSIMEASARDLDSAKQVLVRLVSHELRTPLVNIASVTDIVSRQVNQLTPAQLNELLDSLGRGAQRLGRLVEQIVLIVQFESGALNDDKLREYGVPIQFSELLIASVDLARRFAYRQPDVSIRLDNRDQEARIWGDIRALRHALAELIANALGFSPPRGQVSVSQWQADRCAWISIVDNGPGIPPEHLARALQPFHQIDRETQEQQGIGLGLPVAKLIIEAHGGTLQINSVVDRGTQVTIGFPIITG